MGTKKTAPEHENVMEWEGQKKSSGRGDDYENSVGVCVFGLSGGQEEEVIKILSIRGGEGVKCVWGQGEGNVLLIFNYANIFLMLTYTQFHGVFRFYVEY